MIWESENVKITDLRLGLRQLGLVVVDIIGILLSLYGSLFLRFNGLIDKDFLNNLNHIVIVLVAVDIIIFVVSKLYHSLWEYASMSEARNIVFATMFSSFINIIICELTGYTQPRSCYFIFFMLITMLVGGIRFLYRFARLYRNYYFNMQNKGRKRDRVLVIGAGRSGEKTLREIENSSKVSKEVVCFIDDDKNKHGRTLHNIMIYGGRDKIIEAVDKYHVDEIFVAMPSVDKKEIAEILNICKETKCKIKTLPGMYQLLNNDIHISDFKDVEIEDLLGREPIKVNLDEIVGYVTNKVIMVTGGGGSIGSELCRQIAAREPKQLIIVDIYENNAYDIQLELRRKYPDLDLKVMIASVRNSTKVNKLFETYHPDIVYHAAAHKHVPLMEDSPNEAVKNNIFGTLNVVKAADQYHTKRFILISTDKAVNPTNIMGATKRICEMIIQTYNKKSKTEYVAVRFGNVLGSNGSVIPLFKKQIKNVDQSLLPILISLDTL